MDEQAFEFDDGFNMEAWRLQLKKDRFYGMAVIEWLDGEIHIMRVTRSYKPKDFPKLIEK